MDDAKARQAARSSTVAGRNANVNQQLGGRSTAGLGGSHGARGGGARSGAAGLVGRSGCIISVVFSALRRSHGACRPDFQSSRATMQKLVRLGQKLEGFTYDSNLMSEIKQSLLFSLTGGLNTGFGMIACPDVA